MKKPVEILQPQIPDPLGCSIARVKASGKNTGGSALVIINKIQKISGGYETVKKLRDEDSANEIKLRILLLCSSPLLAQKGLTDSLAGRFEIIPVKCRQRFVRYNPTPSQRNDLSLISCVSLLEVFCVASGCSKIRLFAGDICS
ncbi:MAG: hypothetical protein ACYSSN_02015 [Planctomycetota bacterium]